MKRAFIIRHIAFGEDDTRAVINWLLTKRDEYKLKYIDIANPSKGEIQILLKGKTRNIILFVMDFVNKFSPHYTIQ